MAYHSRREPLPSVSPELKQEQPALKQIEKERKEADRQISLFQEETQNTARTRRYQIIGQIFDTYWLVESDETLYIVDQHAAHEKVLFEQTMEGLRRKQFTTQQVSPPIILSTSPREDAVIREHLDDFGSIGYEIEEFGEQSWAVSGVPGNLYAIADEKLLRELIDHLSDELAGSNPPDVILEKIASMSCKAAIKGNTAMDAQQMDILLGRLFSLDNPYHCPHGRPTMIAMTHRELDKKFKRIV